MSRWDALKTVPDTKGSGRAPRSWTAAKDSRNENTGRKTVDTRGRFESYSSLRDECKSSRDPVRIGALAQLVSTSIDVLPADQVARDAVQNIFLPFLAESSATHHPNAQLAAIDAVHGLLKDKKHSAFLMAPLVSEVSVEGTEVQVANPIRVLMFRTLQEKLLVPMGPSSGSETRPTEPEHACQCLTRALQEAKRVDQTRHHAGMAHMDVDVSVVRRFLLHALTKNGTFTRIRRLSLELLQSLLQRHPESASALATSLLISDDNPRGAGPGQGGGCSRCGHSGMSPLLQLVHTCDSDDQERSLAMECTAGLVEGMPLGLWLRDDNRARSRSRFRQQVSQALVNVIRATKCALVGGEERTLGALATLTKAALLRIPYRDTKDEVYQESLGLVEVVARLFAGTKSSAIVRDNVSDVLVECMGGRVTPQGQLTTMVVPVKDWLASTKGQVLVVNMLSKVKQGDKLVAASPTKLLRALLRTCPQAMLADQSRWGMFQQCVQTQLANSDQVKRLVGLQLIEAILRGRKDFGVGAAWVVDSRTLVAFVAPILQSSVAEGNASCKCSAVASYGSLLDCDWDILSNHDAGSLSIVHIKSLLILFDESSKASVKLRGEVCKAVGDVCTQYFVSNRFALPDTTGEAKLVCDQVCLAMCTLMSDTAASVRSMALFAAGNLTQSLRPEVIPAILDPAALSRLALEVQRYMDSDDDKVTGNAIRSVAHVTCILLRGDYCAALQNTDVDPEPFLQEVIRSLASRVSLSLVLAQGGGSSQSWKERTAVKKHGWGAANSLSSIFAGTVVHDQPLSVYQDAVVILVECVEALPIVHEKVAISCMTALRALTPDCFSKVSSQQGLVSRLMCTCLVHNADPDFRRANLKVARELDLLLSHVLQSCTIVDANVVLASPAIATSHLDYLYQWMVENKCSVEAFDSFAIAMQNPSVSVDVQVEQRFSTRAMSLLLQMDDLEDEL